MLYIKDGAIFVADAHINKNRYEFYKFLELISGGKIKTKQLFLMGDIFDLLVGGVDCTSNIYKKYIKLLNQLSKIMEIYYFEGNHDFNLAAVFPDIKVFSIKNQPVTFQYGDKKLSLSHGDVATTLPYQIYTNFIRSIFTIYLFNFLDMSFNGYFSKKIIKNQIEKQLCKKIGNFKEIVFKRMKKLNLNGIDIIIDGHFHQNQKIDYFEKKYINLPSFACNKSFIIVQSHNGFKEIKMKNLYEGDFE